MLYITFRENLDSGEHLDIRESVREKEIGFSWIKGDVVL
jgi:hypothetical protein